MMFEGLSVFDVVDLIDWLIIICLLRSPSSHGYAMVARRSGLVLPPLDSDECNYLEENFITCLKEKSIKDEVPEMKCNVEFVTFA
jgi:hypothetical protein